MQKSNPPVIDLVDRDFAYGEMIDALCIVFAAKEREQKNALRKRIKGMQVAGFIPSARSDSRSIAYRLSDVYDYAFGLLLAELGMEVRHIVSTLLRASFLNRCGAALEKSDQEKQQYLMNCKDEDNFAQDTFLDSYNVCLVYARRIFQTENNNDDELQITTNAEAYKVINKCTLPYLNEPDWEQKLESITMTKQLIQIMTKLVGSVRDITALRDAVRSALSQV